MPLTAHLFAYHCKLKKNRWAKINNTADIKKEREATISKLQFVSVATRQLPDANTTIV